MKKLEISGLSRRLTAPSRCCSSANRVIAPSPPEPAQEEKGWSTLMQEYWVLIPAALFGSAAWNIFRHIAKENVRNFRESKLKMEGIEGNQIYNVCSSESLDSLELRKVACKGVYDENNSILVHKNLKSKSGEWINGYNLLTPLIPIPDDPQRNMNTRKLPPLLSSAAIEVKGIYLSQLEHDRYACLGFFKGCATIALGIKKFGNR